MTDKLKLTSIRDNSYFDKSQDTLEMWTTPQFGVSVLWIENYGDDTWACFPLDSAQLRELSAAALAAAEELELNL